MLSVFAKVAGEYFGTIDLLLTDMVMPGMNGKTLAHKIVETHPKIGVIYTCGYTGSLAFHGNLF